MLRDSSVAWSTRPPWRSLGSFLGLFRFRFSTLVIPLLVLVVDVFDSRGCSPCSSSESVSTSEINAFTLPRPVSAFPPKTTDTRGSEDTEDCNFRNSSWDFGSSNVIIWNATNLKSLNWSTVLSSAEIKCSYRLRRSLILSFSLSSLSYTVKSKQATAGLRSTSGSASTAASRTRAAF
ncbi:hypothetical protein OGATHE_003322 [Ogataea polymorpha]|uniref:Uncharacterized protein n=1 Tax=Ogataea polymorpha TaxID=460523 RepID=A0A9P8P3F5_9ASCO|nr:hypothetical protein OGATHE_003322 [Ogataea polymorpha]